MHNIVLINPRISKNRSAYNNYYSAREPLGILALGSYLHGNGYEVRIIDAQLYSEDDVKNKIKLSVNFNTAFVGFSVMTAQVPHAHELSQYLKDLGVKSPIVWGGIHPTLFPEQTSLNKYVDLVVCGHGESTALEIARKMESGKLKYCGIRGIAFKGSVNDHRDSDDINLFPYMNYELLDLKYYLGPSPHYLLSDTSIKALNVLSSRGCPWRCNYCVNHITKNRWRSLSADRFVDELEFQINKYNLDAVRMMDEDFFVSKRRMEAIIKEFKRRNISIEWGTNVRANYFSENYITVDIAKQLKKIGCKFLTFGAESGSDRVLNILKKDITVEQIRRSAETCVCAGITPLYSWMIGIPDQTKKEMRSNISLMVEINKICPSALHTTNWIYRPMPGGELYDLVMSHGLREPDSVVQWAHYGVDKNTGSYAVSELKWIEDPGFVKYLAIFTPHLRLTHRECVSVKSFLFTYLLKIIYKTWDWFVLGYVSRILGNVTCYVYNRRVYKSIVTD